MNFLLWEQYFRFNQQHFDHLDWTHARRLTGKEKDTISSSIRQFQRGEHSEGKHFLHFARSLGDESFIKALEIFIKEEQDHAAVLGRFMELEQISRLTKDRLDNIFRWLRKLAGLEGTVTVLLTAEIISMTYYKALQFATPSILLRQICRQILVDEEMHLWFQGFTLSLLYKKKSWYGKLFSKSLHTILMLGTCCIVWPYHRKVLRAGGFGFFSYFLATWKQFRTCRRMIDNEELSQPDFNRLGPVTQNGLQNIPHKKTAIGI
jgi:hypothetical protein